MLLIPDFSFLIKIQLNLKRKLMQFNLDWKLDNF